MAAAAAHGDISCCRWVLPCRAAQRRGSTLIPLRCGPHACVRSLPYVPGEGSATDYCFTGAASSSVISVTALKEERRVEKVQQAAQQMTQA